MACEYGKKGSTPNAELFDPRAHMLPVALGVTDVLERAEHTCILH
jgi:hypothetical protein